MEGAIVATGCAADQPKEHSSSFHELLEAGLVQAAVLFVAFCFLVFAIVCYIMLCWKRKPAALPTKELERNEEDDQLAAND